MAKIKINSGNRVISIESDDAGVPDVTEGTGPDMIELQDDAMAEPGEENAEFNAAEDDSAVEEEDKTEAVEKANESFFNSIFGIENNSRKNSSESFFDGIFGFEDGEEATITDDGDGATSDTDEVVTSDDDDTSEDVSDDSDGSEGDGTTTIDTGDTVITITNSDSGDEGDDVGDEGDVSDVTDSEPEAGEESADPDEMNNDQAIESFFQNLGL